MALPPFYMKPYTYLSLIFACALALIPPMDWFIRNPYQEWWLWMVTMAAFLGILTIFIKTSWCVRLVALGGLLNCFFAAIPYLSFTSYVLLIACCYFYILAERIEDWNMVFKALQAVLLLNLLLLVMKCLHHDPLMNFNDPAWSNYGVMGHYMLEGSFLVVLSGILISFYDLNIIAPFILSFISATTWGFFCAAVGLFWIVYNVSRKAAILCLIFLFMAFLGFVVKHHKITENMDHKSGRIIVWERSFEMASKKPWIGWGIGSYKDVFPPLSQLTCIPWRTAHNFIAELSFEIGYPLTSAIVFSLGFFMGRLFTAKLYVQLAGMMMVFLDALVHFPDRMTQCVLIIILLLAYSSKRLKEAAL